MPRDLDRDERWKRRLTIGGAVFCASTLLPTYLSFQAYAISPEFRGPEFARRMWLLYLLTYWLWTAAAPLVIWVGRRFPLGSPHRLRRWVINLVAAQVIVGALLLIAGVLRYHLVYLGGPKPLSEMLPRWFIQSSAEFYLLYVILLLGTYAVDYFRKLRERELRTAQLEASLQQAKLAALQAQLNPHFLFNALNSVSALMYRDVNAADAMLARIGELLRLTLAADGAQEVRLSEELELLERYLDIERIRFADRLAITVDVPESALGAHVPPFSLQPLVENAIRHGVAPRPHGGQVVVSARQVEDRLQLRVTDDGPGLGAGMVREGIGLRNTRDRLRQLYGNAQQLAFRNPEAGGLEVMVELPWRT
ncbi:MAG TPA: histidine kinase [Myxococcaceae bacterium]|nr:histidine kinase [Myxococcaceae bacterium]